MFQQVIPRSFLWLVSLCAVLIIGIVGCGGDEDDENEWVGTWSLDTINGESIQAQLEAFEQLAAAFGEEIDISYSDEWTFDADGTWHREATLKSPNEEGDTETTSIEGSGTYSLSGSNFTITVTEVTGDFETETVDIEVDFEDIASGTWSRKGNTLTLTADDGTTLGFKKK